MTQRQRLSVLALFLTVTLIPAAAQAAPVLFDLEGEAPSFGVSSLTLNSGGVTMTITREGIGTFGVQQPFGFPPIFGTNVLSPFAGNGGSPAFLVNLSQPTYFFGLDFGDIADDDDFVTLQAFSGLNQTGLISTQTFPYPDKQFPAVESISIAGPNPALSLRFFGVATEPNGEPGLPNTLYFDNIRLDTSPSAPVPEPASLLLLVPGLAGVAFRNRRQS